LTHGRPEAGIRSHRESVKLSELDQWFLSKIWVNLDLEGPGLDPRITENVEEECALDIAKTDILGRAFVNEFLHCAPSLVQRSIFCQIGLETTGTVVRVYLRRWTLPSSPNHSGG